MSEQHQAEPDRGIAMRVGVSGGDDGTMIEMTAVLAAHAERPDIDFMLDKMMGAAQRQRAKRQLPALRHELDETQKVLDENREKLAGLIGAYEKSSAQRREHIERVRREYSDLYTGFAAGHEASGKRVKYEPRGAEKVALGNKTNDVAVKLAEQKTADEEYKIAREQLENEVKRRQHSVEILERRIRECQAEVGGDESGDAPNGHADLQASA